MSPPPEIEIKAPDSAEAFRVRALLLGQAWYSKSFDVRVICRSAADRRILGFAGVDGGRPHRPRRYARVVLASRQGPEHMFDRLLGALLQACRLDGESRGELATPPIPKDDQQLSWWKAKGFVKDSELHEVAYQFVEASIRRIEKTISRLRETGRIPPQARVDHYGPEYLPQVRKLLERTGLVDFGELEYKSGNPASGYDRDLSSVVLMGDRLVACQLVTVRENGVHRVDLRIVDAGFRRSANWPNALLLHHLATRAWRRGIRTVHYRFDDGTMPESGRLGSRGAIPARWLGQFECLVHRL